MRGESSIGAKKIDMRDLLGREVIKLDFTNGGNYITGKVILVTGGGGSIGSELCRQIVKLNPKLLIILDIYENNIYDIEQELSRTYGLKIDVISVVASIRDKNRMEKIFKMYKPDVVFHAAAHKHVPLMENNPSEAIKNNVFGTINVASLSIEYNVKRFIFISTDKAVNPTNIMGATKRIAELIIQNFDKKSDTEFAAVRFGNVLGSNGSVIPLFRKQIEEGGPVTVTHPDIIRYFMTISEAVSLVIEAGVIAKGGEIFVLDMGEPVKILDLAKNLIKISGYKLDKDIKIVFTGIRPGEKLYEELLMAEEGLNSTRNKKIFISKPINIDDEKLNNNLKLLGKVIAEEDRSLIDEIIKKIVPTYEIWNDMHEIASTK